MPVILPQENESRWVRNSTKLSSVLEMLNPYPFNLMNFYPMSTKIADKTVCRKNTPERINKRKRAH